MAVWQYEVLLLPKSAFVNVFPQIPARLEDRDLEEFDWWDSVLPPSDFADVLGRILPASDTWSNDVQIWGLQDGNRIQVVNEQGQVIKITAFVDVRDLDMAFVNDLVNFALHCNCLFLLKDLTLIEPNPYELVSKNEDSSAFQFVRNPERFMEQLRRREELNFKQRKRHKR
jgi:hypothetical protein